METPLANPRDAASDTLAHKFRLHAETYARGGRHPHPGGIMSATLSAVHPVLMARDVASSIAFFARLGFAERFRDDDGAPRYAVVQRGPVELHLQWADPSQWAHDGDRPAYRFLAPTVDALHAEFEAAGVFAALSDGRYRALTDTPWGTREFHLRDPGENVLQFYSSR
jgi:catechol 2,3-dioxygenase-like lactoylglutathione lyase family enzyme